MIWMDDDAIPTKSWLKDPMKAMVEENLIVFYDNFPQGSVRKYVVSCHCTHMLQTTFVCSAMSSCVSAV
jgi:hypothetical protein